MPQEFQVLQCFKCSTFQVHQVKKSNKWNCKLCGEKQSVKKVFGRGSGSDCRCHVQKLNTLRGEIDAEREIREVENSITAQEEEEGYPHNDSQHRTGEVRDPPPRWAKYLDGDIEEVRDDQSDDEDDDRYTTNRERFNTLNKINRKRKRDHSNDLSSTGRTLSQMLKGNFTTSIKETYGECDNSRLTNSLYGPSVDNCRNKSWEVDAGSRSASFSKLEEDCAVDDINSFKMSENENISHVMKYQHNPNNLQLGHDTETGHAGNRNQTLSKSSTGKLSVSCRKKQVTVSGGSKWDKFTDKTDDSNDDNGDNDDDDNDDNDNFDTRLNVIARTGSRALPPKDDLFDDVQNEDNNICSLETTPKTDLIRRKNFVTKTPLGYHGKEQREFLTGVQTSAEDSSLANQNVHNSKENWNPQPYKPNFSVGDVEDDDLDLDI